MKSILVSKENIHKEKIFSVIKTQYTEVLITGYEIDKIIDKFADNNKYVDKNT
jgi:hypothetical protein